MEQDDVYGNINKMLSRAKHITSATHEVLEIYKILGIKPNGLSRILGDLIEEKMDSIAYQLADEIRDTLKKYSIRRAFDRMGIEYDGEFPADQELREHMSDDSIRYLNKGVNETCDNFLKSSGTSDYKKKTMTRPDY